MFGKSLIVAGLLLTSNASEASMNGQTIRGEILDTRIADCGVRIDGTELARLQPFIETSEALAGTFRISLTKRSPSGTSVTTQANRFSGGSLGRMILAVDRPAEVTIDMQVDAEDGTSLCRIATELHLEESEIRL